MNIHSSANWLFLPKKYTIMAKVRLGEELSLNNTNNAFSFSDIFNWRCELGKFTVRFYRGYFHTVYLFYHLRNRVISHNHTCDDADYKAYRLFT